MTVDELWDALRQECCSIKPYTDAKAIVMLRKEDIRKALKRLKENNASGSPNCPDPTD